MTRTRKIDDQGGTELFMLVVVFALLIGLGLVVDGGGYMRAKDQAGWCAEQAARAAAERVDLIQVQTDGMAVVLSGPAASTASQSAADGGMVGTTTLNADGSVTVTCTTEYTPVVLAVVGGAPWSVTEQATARPARGISGEE